MKKMIKLLMLALLVSPAFAQETQDEIDVNAVTQRGLAFYLDTFSGHLTDNTNGRSRLFDSNEFEFGMTYSQNFAKTPWLSMWIRALVATGARPSYFENGDFAGYNNTNGDAFFIQSYGRPRVQLGLAFGGYGFAAIDTRGLFATGGSYNVGLGKGGNLLFHSSLEMFLFPIQGKPVIPNGTVGHVVDLFTFGLNYSISFAEKWTFASKLAFRFGGNESATQFRESFVLRWENQLLYQVTKSFTIWTQLRYDAANTANSHKVDNRLALQAGLVYNFDFSKN